jgi:CRP-like cAMP-binding protein
MDMALLKSVSFLKKLNSNELAAFAKLLQVRQVKAGEEVIAEGAPIEAFYIVCSGVMHVRRTAQKRKVLLGLINAGGFFGEINLFDPGLATASVCAMKKSELASIDYAAFRSFMELNPRIGYQIVSALMSEVARRLRNTNERLVSAVYWSSQEP